MFDIWWSSCVVSALIIVIAFTVGASVSRGAWLLLPSYARALTQVVHPLPVLCFDLLWSTCTAAVVITSVRMFSSPWVLLSGCLLTLMLSVAAGSIIRAGISWLLIHPRRFLIMSCTRSYVSRGNNQRAQRVLIARWEQLVCLAHHDVIAWYDALETTRHAPLDRDTIERLMNLGQAIASHGNAYGKELLQVLSERTEIMMRDRYPSE